MVAGEQPHQVVGRQPAECQPHRAGAHGAEQRVRRGRGEDEHRGVRRLLERLEQGVLRALGEGVGVAHGDHPPLALERAEAAARQRLADHVDLDGAGIVGRQGDHVDVDAATDAIARPAHTAGVAVGGRLAVDRLGQGLRDPPLPHAGRAGEEQRRRHRAALHRAGEQRDLARMADHVAEWHRAGPVYCGRRLAGWFFFSSLSRCRTTATRTRASSLRAPAPARPPVPAAPATPGPRPARRPRA